MTPIKTMLTMAALSLPLMAATCAEQQAKFNTNLQAKLVAVCTNVESVFVHYDAVAAVEGAVSARTMRRVELARAQVDRVCASPETATSVTMLAAAASSYLAVRAALKEAGEPTAAWDAQAKRLKHEFLKE